MVTANSVKFSSVTYKIFPSKTGEPSRSTSDAQSLLFGLRISTRSREYDNILCPSLCWNDLSSQAPHKSSLLRENFKITFKSVLGHIRFVLMLVLHFAKSRDVTSLLKWVYTSLYFYVLSTVLRTSIFTLYQDGWILAEFSFCVFMDRDEVEVHKNVKRERGQYPAILTELAWSINDLLYGIKSTETNDLRICLFSSTEKEPS